MQFLIDYIIYKEKLLTVEKFNINLSNCKLSARDAGNKPCPFKKKTNGKYEGSAGQLRVLSRLMILALDDCLDNSAVGEMLVALQELSEIVVAPRLTLYEIENTMKDVIESYLDHRIRAIYEFDMPRPRPKHHMLSHYPECFKTFGPLIGRVAFISVNSNDQSSTERHVSCKIKHRPIQHYQVKHHIMCSL